MTLALPDRFILYRREWDSAKQKWQKLPCDKHGMNINAHDPSMWLSHAEASRHALWDESRPKAPYGVGFVFNGDGLFLLDLDDALNADGKTWKTDADLLFQSFNGVYVEISTSGNGLHIIGRCDPSRLADRRNRWNGDREFYMDGRFVALSQQGLTLRGDALVDQTDMLLKVVPQREFLGDLPEGRDPAYTGPDDDDELISMALRSQSVGAAFGGVSFKDLWEGNAVAVGQKYPDPARSYDASAADMALMSHLSFWTGKDAPRMDRLFRRSALCREKYLTRDDYRRDTVQNAIRLTRKVYDRPKLRVVEPGEVPKNYMTVGDQLSHFAGCTYVRDVHRVLVPDGELLKPEQFNASYGGYTFQMDLEQRKHTTKAFEVFTESQACRFPKARTTCFRPDLEPGSLVGDEVNSYVAPDVDIRPGDVSPFLDLLQKMLPNDRDRNILLTFLASMVQNRGVKFQWAVVVQGEEGNGKSFLSAVMSYILGRRYVSEPRANKIAGDFTYFDDEKLLVVVEEADMGGKRQIADAIKPRITNLWIEVESKGKNARLIRNVANWILLTNHQDAILKHRGDRRYCIFFTAQQSIDDIKACGMTGEYFPALWDWFHGDGAAYVAHYLMTYALAPEFDPAGTCRRAPETSTTHLAIAASLGGIEAEILEAVEVGRIGFRGGWISSWHLSELMREQNVRISRPRVGHILKSLGYSQWGRAPQNIVQENLQRPNLWRMGGEQVSFEDYLRAQGAGYG